MIDFELGDDLAMIVETARSFATDELLPGLRDREASRSVEPAVRKTWDEMGLAGLELPESLGGAGLGSIARVLVNEEIAAGDAGAALALDALGPALYPLVEVGGEDAVRSFGLPLLEQAGARAILVRDLEGEIEVGSSVTGSVPWIPSERADLVVLLCEDEVVVVQERIELEPVRGAGVRAAGGSELRFEASPVAARFRDAAGVARALARARLYMASLLVGVMRQAAEFSREYALERQAFGRPIAHHQGLAFLITDMRSAVDGARLLLHDAAWRCEAGVACEAAAAMAFGEAIEASRLVGPNGVQILGGHGFMQDYPVEKHMREARLLGLTLGGIDSARDDAAEVFDEVGASVSLLHVERE